MLNSQRGISYLPTGHGSKEKWQERQDRARTQAEEVEDAYAEYVPKQNFDKRDLREISRDSKRRGS